MGGDAHKKVIEGKEGREGIDHLIQLPEEFDCKIYIPEFCTKCEVYSESKGKVKLYGIRITTPYSFLLLEGCNVGNSCPFKTFQLMHYGIFIKFPDEDSGELSLLENTWQMLCGELEEKNIDELVKAYKIAVGYVNTDKKVKRPKEVKKKILAVVKALMLSRLPVFVRFPYPKRVHRYINWDKISDTFEIIEEPCKFDVWDMMNVWVYYINDANIYKMSIELLPEKHPKESGHKGVMGKKIEEGMLKFFETEDGKIIDLQVEIIRNIYDNLLLLYYTAEDKLNSKIFDAVVKKLQNLNVILRQ